MRNYIATLIATFSLLGCDSGTSKFGAKSIEQKWTTLITTEGCLVGSQNAIDGLGEGTCLREPVWANFLRDPSQNKIDFLIGRTESVGNTSIHNCHVDYASEGELAVFVLQHLSHKLWTDYTGDNRQLSEVVAEYNKSLNSGAFVSDQATIRKILGSDSMRYALTTYFKDKTKPNKSEMATPRKPSD